MKANLFIKNKKIVLFPLILLSLLIIAFAAYFFINMITASLNGNKVADFLSTLTYTETAANDELSELEALAQMNPLPDAEKGKLYRAMSEISYMISDEMTYNKYVATALFYSKKAGDNDTYLYIYSKYVGRLYANGCYNAAKELINDVADGYDISSLPLSTQCSYFLSYADINEMLGIEPSFYIQAAEVLINQMPDDSVRKLTQAKIDLLKARNFIQNNDFESAENIMSSYTQTDDFGLGENQVYVVCDYRIPFFELSAKLALNRNDTELARSYTDKYIAVCDSYNFRMMKLRLLKYMSENSQNGVASIDNYISYGELEKETAKENLDEMTEKYGHFLLADIEDIYKNLRENAASRENSFRNIVVIISCIYIVILFYCFISIFTDYENRDGLTNLKNRKMYDKTMRLCKRKAIPYCLLLLDIDDFKSVNDNYGHERGDEVLRSIASIINSYSGRGVSAYRYGGEELCLVLQRVPEKRAREIAEEIRISAMNRFSDKEPHVTISGGVAISTNGENVLNFADAQLYTAKRNGKNQIV